MLSSYLKILTHAKNGLYYLCSANVLDGDQVPLRHILYDPFPEARQKETKGKWFCLLAIKFFSSPCSLCDFRARMRRCVLDGFARTASHSYAVKICRLHVYQGQFISITHPSTVTANKGEQVVLFICAFL